MEKIEDLREQIIKFGKEVAAQHTTTQFPDWCLLKIGVSLIEGFPFETKYWENRIKPGVSASDED